LIVDPPTIAAPVVGQVRSSAPKSPQLERGEAEHALEADGADRSSIHPRGLEYRRKAVVVRQRDRFTIDTWDVEKDFARAIRRERHDPRGRRRTSRDGAAVADIGIRELEARLTVVFLLRHHAVETDGAPRSVRDGRVPHAQPMATAAHIASHDVEAEEREPLVVIDAGDGRGRRAVEVADEKSIGGD